MKKTGILAVMILALTGLLSCTDPIISSEESTMVYPTESGSSSQTADSGTGAEDPMPERVLKVGFGKASITPTEEQMKAGILLRGGAANSILDDVYVIALAFQDEEDNLYIHIVADLTSGGMADENVKVSYGVCDMGRKAIQTELGISPEDVTISATQKINDSNFFVFVFNLIKMLPSVPFFRFLHHHV